MGNDAGNLSDSNKRDPNLEALIDRAVKDSNPVSLNVPGLYLADDNPISFAQRLSSWGVAYSILGDKEAGNKLFEEALRIISYAKGDPGSYAYHYRKEVAYAAEVIRNEEPLVNLSRASILLISVEDMGFLHGMMDNYYQALNSDKMYFSPKFMESVAANKRPSILSRLKPRKLQIEPPPMPLPDVFEKRRLPSDIIKRAEHLVNVYNTRRDTFSLRRECATVARQVYGEYVNRLIDKYNITP